MTLSSVTKANSVVRFKLKRDHKTWFYYIATFANFHDKPNLCCDFFTDEQVRWGYLLSSLLKLLKLAKSIVYMPVLCFRIPVCRFSASRRFCSTHSSLSRCFLRNLTPTRTPHTKNSCAEGMGILTDKVSSKQLLTQKVNYWPQTWIATDNQASWYEQFLAFLCTSTVEQPSHDRMSWVPKTRVKRLAKFQNQ